MPLLNRKYTHKQMIISETYAQPTKLDGMIDNPKESSSSESTAPELKLKVYPRI